MTRQKKTPRQRAEEQLAAAQRAAARLARKKSDLTKELAAVSREHDAAVARLDYAAANPDLPARPTTSTGDTA